MAENRLRGLMGLCVRAGQAVFGEDSCRREITGGRCGVLLLDGEASPGTAKRYQDWCRTAGTPLIRLPEGLLESATGKPGRAMAVRKGSFADQLIRLGDTGSAGTPRPGKQKE